MFHYFHSNVLHHVQWTVELQWSTVPCTFFSILTKINLLEAFTYKPINYVFYCNSLVSWVKVHLCQLAIIKHVKLLRPANEVWGKVMFLQVFVCPGGGGVGFPACITGHMTRGICPTSLDADPLSPQEILRNMVNKWVVGILLECILVTNLVGKPCPGPKGGTGLCHDLILTFGSNATGFLLCCCSCCAADLDVTMIALGNF